MTTLSQTQGTSVVWTSSGGDEVITLTSLADDAGRQGDEHDFGANFPEYVHVRLELDFNVAPTAGEFVILMWASSVDGTNYDGECTGADAAYSSENDLWRLWHVGSLKCTNDTDLQATSWRFKLPARYGLPVVFNKSGQALTATGTDQKITVTPMSITDGA